MPKRTDIRSILIIGAGPIVIAEVCEFDESGVQACKALREDGLRFMKFPPGLRRNHGILALIYIKLRGWMLE